jgi:NADH-quinone oxidoreductase subunit E
MARALQAEVTTARDGQLRQKMNSVLAAFGGHKEELIPILQKTQEAFGYLPEEAMAEISRFLTVPPSTVFGVATFYAQFKFTPTGKHIVKVCHGTACHARGATRVLDEVQRELGIMAGETSPDLQYSLESIACPGSCALAPVVVVNEVVYGRATVSRAKKILADTAKKES